MTEAIDDVTELPGKTVSDHEDVEIGEIEDIFAVGGDGEPTYVSVAAKFGMGDTRKVLIPLARLKIEQGDLRVPYSADHVKETPVPDNEGEITEDEDRALRDHYGIDSADQELREDNDSYATLVPGEGTVASEKADDPDNLETPDANKKTEETEERLKEAGSSEIRDVDAGEIAEASTGGGDSGGEEPGGEASGEEDEDADDDPQGKGEEESKDSGSESGESEDSEKKNDES